MHKNTVDDFTPADPVGTIGAMRADNRNGTASPRRRIILIALATVVVSVLGVAGFFASVLTALGPGEAVLACTTDSYRVTGSVACWWAKGPANIDPNEPAIDGDEMTVFMFTVNGFGLESGLAPDEHDDRVLDLLEHWSSDVDWTITDQLGLTPLHAAVLHNDPVLVRALLDMGAPEDLVAGDATETFDGLTPAELVEVLREQTVGTEFDDESARTRRAEIASALGVTLDG